MSPLGGSRVTCVPPCGRVRTWPVVAAPTPLFLAPAEVPAVERGALRLGSAVLTPLGMRKGKSVGTPSLAMVNMFLPVAAESEMYAILFGVRGDGWSRGQLRKAMHGTRDAPPPLSWATYPVFLHRVRRGATNRRCGALFEEVIRYLSSHLSGVLLYLRGVLEGSLCISADGGWTGDVHLCKSCGGCTIQRFVGRNSSGVKPSQPSRDPQVMLD